MLVTMKVTIIIIMVISNSHNDGTYNNSKSKNNDDNITRKNCSMKIIYIIPKIYCEITYNKNNANDKRKTISILAVIMEITILKTIE